ncbi:hypothetical protein FOL47_004516 [Perkinsus chesapeaki]|uniref:Uncharacterized protein n=1 Tax=Perkinsus chesapeaki TaxID=330153 RepID=A0A7J6M1V1_PERCH|nr:hypothetical protein FOL47_004516 [Perkinsus chesapeaki]
MAGHGDEIAGCLMKGLEEIEPIRKLLRVDDEIWTAVQVELGTISSVADFAFVLPGDFAECLETLLDWRTCGMSLAMANTGGLEGHGSTPNPAREVSSPRPGTTETVGTRPTKRARMSMFADSLDDSMFDLMPVSEYDRHIPSFSAVYGEVDPTELPSREQLSPIRAQIQDGGAPNADLAIFQPHQRRRLRRAKQEPWVLNDLGIPSQVTASKMPSWEEWKAAFKTFRLSLCILGIATQAEMDRYQSVVESLALTYRTNWPEVYLADDTMRAVYIGRYKSPSENSSWGQAFSKAAKDINYWTTNVDRVIARIRAECGPNRVAQADRPNRGERFWSSCSQRPNLFCIPERGLDAPQEGARDEASPLKLTNEARSAIAEQQGPLLNVSYQNVDVEYLGGLRGAYASSRLLPHGHILFNTIRNEMFFILTPRVVSEALDKLGSDSYSLFSQGVVEDPRAVIARICNIDDSEVSWTTPNSPLRGKVVKALATRCGDWDTEALKWINGHGAPLGLNLPIIQCGIFKEVAGGGYEVNDGATRKAKLMGPHDELRGESFVVSKIALAEKGVDDQGTMKYRMIVDGSESGINELFGFSSSPLLWGREAAMLSPDGREGRINTYVNDPIISVFVEDEGRRRQLKGQCGTKVKWIGRVLEIAKDAIVVYVPVEKLTKIKDMLQVCLHAPAISPGGKAAGILRRSSLGLLGKNGEERAEGSQADEEDGKYLVRRFPLISSVTPGTMMVVDACWKGIGGIGYQNAMELLAILVGTRLWAGRWPRDVPIMVRSDSVVAISSAVKMKSRSEVINEIAMELAYDGARSSQVLDMHVEHIEGLHKCWADALSRLQLGAVMPAELIGVPEASSVAVGGSMRYSSVSMRYRLTEPVSGPLAVVESRSQGVRQSSPKTTEVVEELFLVMQDEIDNRSVNVYIDAVTATAEMQGITFTLAEKGNIRRIKRACVRGIGPDEGAKPISLEAVLKVRRMMEKGSKLEISRSAAYLVGWCYMMRGIEVVSSRIRQVGIKKDTATIRFEVTKNDQKGQGCGRAQACTCVEQTDRRGCPVHTLMLMISLRGKEGATKNDLVFMDEKGEQKDLKNAGVTQAELCSLHSFRVGGTQGHLEAGIAKQSAKVFGRWKSDVIDRYARESYICDSADYSRRVTERQIPGVLGGNTARVTSGKSVEDRSGTNAKKKMRGKCEREAMSGPETTQRSQHRRQLRKGSRWLSLNHLDPFRNWRSLNR